MTVLIKCSNQQAMVIEKAMNMYTRLLMGQFDAISFELFLNGYHAHDPNIFDRCASEMKMSMFPELDANAYYGIYDKEHVSENARIAFDVYQALRYTISWKYHPEGGFGVSFHKPMITSTNEQLPEIKINNEGDVNDVIVAS